MGYYLRVTGGGDYAIVPPLTYKEIREHPALTDQGRRWAYIVRNAQETVTAEGVLQKITGSRVHVGSSDLKDGYKEELREIARAFPDRKFLGFIETVGEDGDDHERVYIRNGDVVTQKATIVWPDQPPAE